MRRGRAGVRAEAVLLIGAILVSRLFAYSWSPRGPAGLHALDWCALPSGQYPSLICADTCVVLESADGWERHSYLGLCCTAACPLDSARVLLALGGGGETDGVYCFDLSLHRFSIVCACSQPRFIRYSPRWNAWWAGWNGGMAVSTNGRDWLPLGDFAGRDCRAMALGESTLVAAVDTSVFHAPSEASPHFGGRIDLGLVTHEPITEASGLVASRRNAGVLWTHNDSGNPPVIYALSESGVHCGAYTIAGSTNRDWEDIAIGYDAGNDRFLIYIGDIGDNNGVHEYTYVYVVEEPAVSPTQPPASETIGLVHRLTLQYPDGARYNAETLLMDPLTNDLYVVTKQGGGATVFRAPFPHPTSEPIILEHVVDLSGFQGPVVGGDIGPSGREILLKTYAQVFYWRREEAETVAEAFVRPPIVLPYVPEPQGEAICWSADMMRYLTVSEEQGGVPARLYGYVRQMWSRAQPPHLEYCDVVAAGDGRMFASWRGASCEAGLWGSADNGATWAQELASEGLNAVGVESHGVVFLGFGGGGINAGMATWAAARGTLVPVNEGIPSLVVNRVRTDPRAEFAVVACTDSGAAVLGGYFDPMELDIGLASPDTLGITWSCVPGAVWYDLYLSPQAFDWPVGAPSLTLTAPETTAFTGVLAGIPDTALFVAATARNDVYVTPWSNRVGAHTRGLP